MSSVIGNNDKAFKNLSGLRKPNFTSVNIPSNPSVLITNEALLDDNEADKQPLNQLQFHQEKQVYSGTTTTSPNKKISSDDFRMKSKPWNHNQALVIKILVGVLGATVLLSVSILIIYGFKSNSNPPSENDVLTLPRNDTAIFWRGPEQVQLLPVNSPLRKKVDSYIVAISSHLHLHGITEFTHTVKVESLVSRSTPSGLSQSGREAVRTLELIGPISQRWLHYLLSSFKFLTSIIINVDKVCSNLGPINLYKTIPIELIQLEKIVAENSQKCGLMSWGFNIETPALKTIEVSKANLSEDFYTIFFELLNKTSSTLQGIEISESTICSKCDITELQFDNLLYLRITKSVNNDDYSESETHDVSTEEVSNEEY